MPVYDGERFVAEAIESVLAQGMSDWELIIVDDGSQDATPVLLQGFSDPRIIALRQENQGAAAARNAALDIASGDFVGFLDADDLYLPNALQDLVAYLDSHPDCGVVYSDGVMCDADKNHLMRLTEVRSSLDTGWVLERIVLSASLVTVPACTLTRRAAIEHNAVRFDVDLAPSEDYYFWISLACCVQFGYLDQLTCLYRIHQGNISQTTKPEKRREDLARLQVKVMQADWFPDLSVSTRQAFFHGLLVGLLSGMPDRQQAVIRSKPFADLPLTSQSTLLRLVASDYLRHQTEIPFARKCLEQALAMWPADRKARMLNRLTSTSPFLAAMFLVAWEFVHETGVRIHKMGGRRPKAVPRALQLQPHWSKVGDGSTRK